jgi:hypothetical protein
VTTSANLGANGAAARGKDVFLWRGQSYALFGGSGDEEPTAAAVVGNQTVLAGWTNSHDFPIFGTSSLQPHYGGGARDGFLLVSPLSSNGFSTYLGGSGDDAILAVAVDPLGRTLDFGAYYLAGETDSPDFPVKAAVQPTPGGGKDGFVTHVSARGAIIDSTYFGGSGDDSILSLASTDLPLSNAIQGQPGGGLDGFLARIDRGVTPALGFATYFGGSADDEVRGLRIAPDGWIWAGGITASPDLAVTMALQSTLAGDTDVWIGRFHPGVGTPSFVTYLGGSAHDELSAMAFDGNGELWLAGWTTSPDLQTVDALQPQPAGGEDGLLARLDRYGAPQMLTYLGGAP